MEKWYKIMPASLMDTAYKCSDSSGTELAWPKEQALQVLQLLQAHGYILLGVDPWLPTMPGPTPLTFDWIAKKLPRNDKFPDTAAEFIEQFEQLHPLKDGEAPVFRFCVQS